MLPTRDRAAVVVRVLSAGVRDQKKRVHGQHECDSRLHEAQERSGCGVTVIPESTNAMTPAMRTTGSNAVDRDLYHSAILLEPARRSHANHAVEPAAYEQHVRRPNEQSYLMFAIIASVRYDS